MMSSGTQKTNSESQSVFLISNIKSESPVPINFEKRLNT